MANACYQHSIVRSIASASSKDAVLDAYADPKQIISHVWGPPPSLPRQFDTYLTHIPENSPLVAKTGFSGTVLKSSASAPPQSN